MTDQPRRILVVDDDLNILRVIEGVLVDEGMQVETASDGGRALELLEQATPDLLILDVTLPTVNSGQVANRLRELHGDAVPVLVITADGRAAEKARRLRAYTYLRKPFDLANLVSTVQRGLSS